MESRDGVTGASVGRGRLGWRGAVGRRSRLSFQCEEVEGETQQNAFSDVQTTEKPHLKQSHTHIQHTSQCLHIQC